MLVSRFVALAALSALLAQPCSLPPPLHPPFWSKEPGSQSKLFAFQKDGKAGFIDASGTVVVEPSIETSAAAVGDFFEGLARVGGRGFINESGEWLIRTEDYKTLGDFSEGLALVSPSNPERYLDEYAYIDKGGAIVATVRALDAADFSEGLASFVVESDDTSDIMTHGGFGVIDRSGAVTVEPKFAYVGSYSEGLAPAVVDGFCYVNGPVHFRGCTPSTGCDSCGGAPEEIISPCPAGFIDAAGDFAIPPRFEGVVDFSEGLAAVQLGGRWGFIDDAGSVAIQPNFEEVGPFSEGLAAVSVNGKWGFVDKTGQIVIEPQFSWVEDFSDSTAIASKEGKPFYIDRNGTPMSTPEFVEITPFVHGLAAVRIAPKHIGYINKTGAIVFEYALD